MTKCVNHIYVVRAANGSSKIGHAGNVQSRVSSMQVGSAEKLTLIYSARSERTPELEKRAHEILRAHRISGEWFAVPSNYAVAAIQQAAHELGISLRARAGKAPKQLELFPKKSPVIYVAMERTVLETLYDKASRDNRSIGNYVRMLILNYLESTQRHENEKP